MYMYIKLGSDVGLALTYDREYIRKTKELEICVQQCLL